MEEIPNGELKPILVVDDDPSFLSIITKTFGHVLWPFEVVCSGRQAVTRVRQAPFRVVLLDLKLPDLDGLEVLKHIRSQPVFPPVILVSGAGTIGSAVEAMRLGAHNFLEKPISMPDLLDEISSIPDLRYPPSNPDPRATHEMATLIRSLVNSHQDVKTVLEWAQLTHISSQTLFSRCARIGVSAKAVLDLGRILRAVKSKTGGYDSVSLSLNSLDVRTVDSLLRRAGLRRADLLALTAPQLLARQCLVTNPQILKHLSVLVEGKTP